MLINNYLVETILTETAHIYVDDATGDEYIFNGKKLIKIKDGSKPNIGDKGNESEAEEEDRKREQQAAKEREEDNEDSESEEERSDRLDKIKQFLDDKDVGNQIKHDSEQKVQDEKKRKKAAEKRELEKNLKGAAKNSVVIKQLGKDLGQFLAKEVGKSVRNTTWKKYNGNYDGSPIVRPGNRYEKIGKIPVIQIYIDQSGSWGESDIEIGKQILNSIQEFERKNQIKTEVYYFANHVHNNPQSARDEGGTKAGSEILTKLNTDKPENVIILTDDDFDYFGLSGTYTAPGGVWLVFREQRSKSLIDALKGKKMTKYYDIDKIV